MDCSGRPELQKAQGSPQCPRRNGYFPHEDPTVCDSFYFCVDGVPNPIQCPESLIFDPSKGQCAFSDQVQRRGCSSEEVFKFSCPDVAGSPHEHPRYPDPHDCQYFYICIGGKSARRNGCTVGLVFNPESHSCERPDRVQGPCRNWYNETFLESVGAVASPPRRPNLPPGVTPLSETPGRKRVAVRRRRPQQPQGRPQQAQPVREEPRAPVVQQQQPPQSNFNSNRANVRGTVPIRASDQALASRNRNRNRVRTRVRPRPQPEPVQPPVEEIPQRPAAPDAPTFALSSDADIQRFRQSNRFVPEAGSNSGGGRLTVLSGNNNNAARTSSLPRRPPRPNPVREEDPAGFEAFPAVPRSRRPPQADPRRVPQRPAPAISFEDEEPQFQRREPDLNQADSQPPVRATIRSREPPPFHIDPYQTNFDQTPPARTSVSVSKSSSSSTGRRRLEVTPINVNPQEEIASEDPDSFEISRIRQRNRGRQFNF